MIDFDVFISYSSRDKTIADATCAALESAGIRCWIAPRDVTPGMAWPAAIIKALDSCRVMVLIFSSTANESVQIRREVERAMNRGIPVVPLRIEDIVPTDELEFFMGSVHWLDAWTPPLEHHLTELGKAVRGFLASDLVRRGGHGGDGAEGETVPHRAQRHEIPDAVAGNGAVRHADAKHEALSASDAMAPKRTSGADLEGGGGTRRGPAGLKASLLLSGVAAVVVGAAMLFWFGAPVQWARVASSRPAFDAAAVPLLTESARANLADYPRQPAAKALAISADSYGVSVGARDQQTAQREALDQCRVHSQTICRIYAAGLDVTWSKDWIPLPPAGDLRTEPLDFPLPSADFRQLFGAEASPRYLGGGEHRALAYTNGGNWFVIGRTSRAEAVRQAVERCGYVSHRACMIISVAGAPTVQIPRSRRITGPFLPGMEPDLSEGAKQRVGQIYQGGEWRALARGKSGTWYAVASQPNELAAVEAALKSCGQGDAECSIYAIGNFRVADSL